MNVARIMMACILMASFTMAPAQRRSKVRTKRQPKKEVKEEGNSRLFKQMMPATAKVMFIDSVVVDKSDFLSKVPLNRESGEMQYASSSDQRNAMAIYKNEFGDRRVLAKGDTVKSRLYTQILLGDKWGEPRLIADFPEATYSLQNYPFLCADGLTLFFSAEGPESLGGRDIYMSSFNSDATEWYKPQNYGLPFNSTANDYFLAIDDLDTLGWLVSDRFQPKGKVCIYTFAPTVVRQNFDSDNVDEAQLLSYAKLSSIKDTWKFGNRAKALSRLARMKARMDAKRQKATMRFVVDDNTIITSPSLFRNNESKLLYKQVEELTQMISETNDKLSKARLGFHNGNKALSEQILYLEGKLPQLKRDLYSIEKKIRLLEKAAK